MPRRTCSFDRRDFLKAGSLAAGASLLDAAALEAAPRRRATAKRCIVLVLTGGPSQLDTFDPKPDAPSDYRGPFKTTASSVPGVRLCEHLPRTARRMQHLALLRSLHHEAAPVHETGMQLLQTGRLCTEESETPHFGAVLARLLGPNEPGVAPFVLLPAPLGSMGLNVSRGQGAGHLGSDHSPVIPRRTPLDSATRERYGRSAFGDDCARALCLVERGARCAVVNMFDSITDRVTWDCHAIQPHLPSTLNDYRRTLCPAFDSAFAALLDDLRDRGLFDETLVVTLGEFGRTPRLNDSGGRDHWPGVWSIVLAGGGVRGGQVIGASDRLGAEPAQRPVRPAEVVATVYHAHGIDPRSTPHVDASPIAELFA